MEKILSLDLGSNSIGATIRDTSEREKQFKKTTVITFETGVGKDDKGKFTLSHAAERTSKRSIRRLYQSRKYKLWETLKALTRDNKYCPLKEESLKRWKEYNKEEALKGNGGRAYPVNDIAFNNWIKLDFDNDGKPDYISPYELREELATVKLDFNVEENRFKLGRALYHIAQHRGFKSSKKVQNADDEKDDNEGENYDKDRGAEGKKKKKFWEEIDKLGLELDNSKTVGEAFSFIEKKNNENGTNIRIRRELHQFVTRKMLMQEVEAIFKFQELSFGSIFKNDKGEELAISQSPVFWQRPLRSQKGTVGKCTLEPNKFRCPASHPAFEEFRARSLLNNIKYRTRGDKSSEWRQIPLEYREEIYKEKFFRISKKDFYFGEIAEWIKKQNPHDDWELNYSNKTNVSACPVSASLHDIFGEEWKHFELVTEKVKKEKKKNGLVKEHKVKYSIEDIWHVLFDSDDDDIIEAFGKETLGLHDKKLKRFLGLFKSMPVAYSMLSLKAINNILPFLRLGKIYTEATLLAKVPKILGDEIWKANKDMILSNLETYVIDKNREEKKILNIVNNLIAQYKALPQKFAENEDYVLGDSDNRIGINSNETDANQILKAIKDSYGENTWKEQSEDEQQRIIAEVSKEYQSFFSGDRKFKTLPHLQQAMKKFLADSFDFLYCPNTSKELKDGEVKCECSACKKLNFLYHPSQIDIYPPAKEGSYKYGDMKKKMVMLGSPITGAFKNPMALRALHELRKYINYLIATEQIDEQTRIVVEIPRDSNLEDNNKRWAWNEYQARRREENKEFRDAIYELVKTTEGKGSIVNADSDSDIDKFRIWYEMLQGGDAIDGFIKDKKFVALEKTVLTKTSKKGVEQEIEELNEHNYLKINKSLFFKLQQAKENIEAKYRLWKEQQCLCMYTGKVIRITDLFQENVIDFEHTVARSKSLDNSLANLTVCYADYNRNIKKNRLPTDLDNYDKPAYGYSNGSILSRLEKWKQKVKDLQLHVEFWKGKSKRGSKSKMISPTSNISEKDFAIRQRHLWEFELRYWEDKISRFTMTEVKSGFRKSQLVDTQIISKYAFHYLKTFFNSVEVQKGSVTAEFRKIFGIQEIGTVKDRTKHTHHAKDAVVLSLIPTPQIREKMLTLWYEIDEQKELLKSDTEPDKKAIQQHIEMLEEKLRQLKYQCNLPNVNVVIEEIDEQVLINNTAKDQTLSTAKKRIRSRGKIVPLKDKAGNIIYQTDENGNKIQRTHKDGNLVWKTDENGHLLLDERGDKIPVYKVKEKWAKGDAIRGQLHLDTYYGKIKKAERDENDELKRDENGNLILEFDKKRNDFVYDVVLRKEVNKDFDIDKIVNPELKDIVNRQLNGRTIGTASTEDGGIWMLKKDGSKAHKIRHIRCYADDVKNPVAIRKQTHQHQTPTKAHKNFYWAKNAENSLYGYYWDGSSSDRGYECLNLLNLAGFENREEIENPEEFFPLYKQIGRGNKKISVPLFAVLIPDVKVIFYEENFDELKNLDQATISKRLYKMNRIFDSKQGLIQFHHHLEARDDKELSKAFPKEKFGDRGKNGFSEINFNIPYPKLLLSSGKFNFAIEGKHFLIKPEGEINWR